MKIMTKFCIHLNLMVFYRWFSRSWRKGMMKGSTWRNICNGWVRMTCIIRRTSRNMILKHFITCLQIWRFNLSLIWIRFIISFISQKCSNVVDHAFAAWSFWDVSWLQRVLSRSILRLRTTAQQPVSLKASPHSSTLSISTRTSISPFISTIMV